VGGGKGEGKKGGRYSIFIQNNESVKVPIKTHLLVGAGWLVAVISAL
jgi:hypothetical protein